MANVREVFPTIEKLRRVQRGHLPKKVWNKAPTLDVIVSKMFTVVDSHIKTVNAVGAAPVELRRYILRNKTNFGYLCIKTANYHFDRCQSVADFQKAYDTLEAQIKWSNSLATAQAYVAAHCTSPSYVERVRKIRV